MSEALTSSWQKLAISRILSILEVFALCATLMHRARIPVRSVGRLIPPHYFFISTMQFNREERYHDVLGLFVHIR